jgi:hypothetical protein
MLNDKGENVPYVRPKLPRGMKSDKNLSIKQRQFINAYIDNNLNATAAFKSLNLPVKSIEQSASKMLNHPAVQDELKAMRRKLAIKISFNSLRLFEEYNRLYDLSLEDGSPAAIANATKILAQMSKLLGLDAPTTIDVNMKSVSIVYSHPDMPTTQALTEHIEQEEEDDYGD